jgi:hypothetical protein
MKESLLPGSRAAGGFYRTGESHFSHHGPLEQLLNIAPVIGKRRTWREIFTCDDVAQMDDGAPQIVRCALGVRIKLSGH